MGKLRNLADKLSWNKAGEHMEVWMGLMTRLIVEPYEQAKREDVRMHNFVYDVSFLLTSLVGWDQIERRPWEAVVPRQHDSRRDHQVD